MEFTQAEDPRHPRGERGRIVFKDYNGDFHILWEQAGAEVWSVAQVESELRLVSPPTTDYKVLGLTLTLPFPR